MRKLRRCAKKQAMEISIACFILCTYQENAKEVSL